MGRLIQYNKIMLSNISKYGNLPNNCPKCQERWKSEPPPIEIIQEGLFGDVRMAQEYYKVCEFCGSVYHYWR